MKKIILTLTVFIVCLSSFGQLTTRITDQNNRIASIDQATHSLQTVTYEHHEIHSGSHYFIEDFVTLGSGDSVIFIVTTPNSTKWAHMVFGHQSGAGGYYFNVFEGVTESGGTAYTKIYNNNRNSSNTSMLSIKTGATVTDNGTHIVRNAFGTGTGASSNTGQDDRDHELILKANTKYMFTFKSKANSNDISFDVSWYEHTNKSY